MNNDIHILISTYLADGLSPQDEERLRQWITLSPENDKYFRDMQEIWFATRIRENEKHFNKSKAYERFLSRTDSKDFFLKVSKRRTVLRPFIYGAAAILLLLIISYVSYWQGSEQLKSQFANVVIESPLGSRTKMYLPDGTLVWLNAGSIISYSQGFGVNDRNIDLSGEGYFEVVKNDKLPFAVNTKEMHVKVVGTIFNFRNYQDEDEATVSLLEGKVWINNNIKENNNFFLAPDQKVFLNKRTGEMRVSNGNVSNMIEWKNGFLFFDEELLSDIVQELERNYNVKINFADTALTSLRFYGSFERREYTIEEILDALTTTNKLKYKKEGKNIVLYPNNIHE